MNYLGELIIRFSPTFAAFASLRLCSGHALREIFRLWVAAQPRWDLRGERNQGNSASVVSQKFIYIFNAMALAEIKSPCVPLFKGGDVSEKALTPLYQRGEGEICVRICKMESPRKHRRIICQELLGTVH